MRFVFALLSLVSTAAWAIPTPNLNMQQWQCQLSASLRGVVQDFVFYGRDSWLGSGTLNCRTKSGLSESRPLTISFRSDSVGFGADPLSVVEVRAFIATFAMPSALMLRAPVSDMDHGPNIRFSLTDHLSEARIYVLSLYPDMALRSLQNGTLYIRGTEEAAN